MEWFLILNWTDPFLYNFSKSQPFFSKNRYSIFFFRFHISLILFLHISHFQSQIFTPPLHSRNHHYLFSFFSYSLYSSSNDGITRFRRRQQRSDPYPFAISHHQYISGELNIAWDAPMSSELQPAMAFSVQGLTPINQRATTPNQVVVSEQRWCVINDDDEGITVVREKLPDYLETAIDRMEDAILIG